jgi:phosphate transport system substrate-binding protein
MKSHTRLLTLGCFAIIGLAGCNTSRPSTSNLIALHQTEIRTGGSSSAYRAIEILGQTFHDQNKATQVTMLPIGQSETAIAGVKNGLMDIAAISRQIKPEEQTADIKYYGIAQDGLLVATHESVTGVKALSTDQLKAIYSGKVTNWKALGGVDAEIIVLDRPEDESAKRLLRKHYLGADLANAPNAVVFKQEGELITALQNTPNAIGAFSLAQAISHKLPVNRLNLNGIEPTQRNIETGKYSMVRHLGVVAKSSPSPSTQSFISFIQSPEGVKILQSQGFVRDSK